MTPEQFCYWLRGAIEMWPGALASGLSGEQVQVIGEHLNLVMTPVAAKKAADKETPAQGGSVPFPPSSPPRIC